MHYNESGDSASWKKGFKEWMEEGKADRNMMCINVKLSTLVVKYRIFFANGERLKDIGGSGESGAHAHKS